MSDGEIVTFVNCSASKSSRILELLKKKDLIQTVLKKKKIINTHLPCKQ